MSTLESDAVQVDSLLRLKNESIINLVGSHNDVDLWSGGPHTSRVEVDLVGGSGATITGIVAGTEGDLLFLWCGGGGTVPEDTLTLVNNSPASAPLNRIWIADGKSLNIPNNDGVLLIYIGGFGWTVFGGATTMIRAQEFSLDPSTTPAALANGSTTNDYNPFAGLLFTSYVKQDTGLASTITGIVAAGSPNSDGRLLVFQNISATGSITVKHSDPGSIPDNRIICPDNVDVVIGPQATMLLIYDDTVTMWRVIGNTGGVFQNLVLTPRAPDQFGAGTNMPAGIINNYTDPGLPGFARLLWKGADNQGTTITGIDATGVPDGAIRIFENMTESGIDAGTVTLNDETSTNAAGSLAANRIKTPGAYDYTVPPFGVVALLRSVDQTGNPRWIVLDDNGWLAKTITQSLQLYPHLEVGTQFNPPISGTLNDWNPIGEGIGGGGAGIAGSNLQMPDHTAIRVGVDAAGAKVTGLHNDGALAYPNSKSWGPVKTITNVGPGVLTLTNQDGASLAGNQFRLPNQTDVLLGPGESIVLWLPYYAGAPVQWQVLAVAQTKLLAPAVTPAPLAAQPAVTDNYNPGPQSRIRVSTNAAGSILGGLVGAYGTDNPANGYGETREIVNLGPGPLVIVSGSVGSAAGNQFNLGPMPSVTLPELATVRVIKDDSNSWVVLSEFATQQDPQIAITPAAMGAGNTNDYDPVDQTTALSFQYATVLRVAGAGGHLTGLKAGRTGQRKLLINFGAAFTIDFLSGLSAAGNQFIISGAANKAIPQWGSVWLYYDVNGFWFVEGA